MSLWRFLSTCGRNSASGEIPGEIPTIYNFQLNPYSKWWPGWYSAIISQTMLRPVSFSISLFIQPMYGAWLSFTYLVASLHHANLQKGDTIDPNNYRPIALTCTLWKIMETIIKDQLLLSINMVSCAIIQLQLIYLNDWTVGVSDGNNIGVVHFNFSKALIVLLFPSC